MKIRFTADIRTGFNNKQELHVFSWPETNSWLPLGLVLIPVEECPVELLENGVQKNEIISLPEIDWDHPFLAGVKQSSLMDMRKKIVFMTSQSVDMLATLDQILGNPLFQDEVA